METPNTKLKEWFNRQEGGEISCKADIRREVGVSQSSIDNFINKAKKDGVVKVSEKSGWRKQIIKLKNIS